MSVTAIEVEESGKMTIYLTHHARHVGRARSHLVFRSTQSAQLSVGLLRFFLGGLLAPPSVEDVIGGPALVAAFS